MANIRQVKKELESMANPCSLTIPPYMRIARDALEVIKRMEQRLNRAVSSARESKSLTKKRS